MIYHLAFWMLTAIFVAIMAYGHIIHSKVCSIYVKSSRINVQVQELINKGDEMIELARRSEKRAIEMLERIHAHEKQK